MWRKTSDRGHRLGALLLSALYPSTCPVCKEPSDSIAYAPLCLQCWQTIKQYRGPSCPLCAAPVTSDCATRCSECHRRPPPFTKVIAFGLYTGALREAIHLLKFAGLRRLAPPLGGLLHQLPIPDADGIIPVPLRKETLGQRGFNQTLLLAGSSQDGAGYPSI